MMEIQIYRHYKDENQASGVCIVFNDNGFPLFTSLSLERGWRDNKNNISCVPDGVYILKYEYSNRFKKFLWELKGVPNRSECKFHAASFWFDLNGCISLGLSYESDFNKDGYKDLSDSRKTMKVFERILKGKKEVQLTIM